MNIENYISSGIIESYVLDQLSEQERNDVQKLATQHPEIRQAIDEIEETFFALGEKGSVPPPSSVKNKLFKDLGIEKEVSNAPLKSEADMSQKADSPDFKASEPKGKSFIMYPFFSAAASIIAVLGIVLSLYYRGQWLSTQDRLSEMITQNETLAQQYNIVKNQSDQYAFNINILRQPGIENVAMEGLEIAPTAQATIHWNKNTNEVFLNAKKMPSNDQNLQYQLWAIVDGAPVDMGVFDVGGDMTSLLKMKNIEKASAFAVTLEPRGGSENPTMDKMFVIGQI